MGGLEGFRVITFKGLKIQSSGGGHEYIYIYIYICRYRYGCLGMPPRTSHLFAQVDSDQKCVLGSYPKLPHIKS